MTVIAAALLGAFLYRVRGGFLPTGSTQLARAIWCVPTGLLVAILTGNGIAGLAAFFMAWAGLLLPNEPWQRMEEAHDWIMAGIIGLVRVMLILLPVAWALNPAAALILGPLGILAAPLYWLGWKLPPRFGPTVRGSQFIDWYTAWGEAFFGALCWTVLVTAAALPAVL